jgi:hypothetical protein
MPELAILRCYMEVFIGRVCAGRTVDDRGLTEQQIVITIASLLGTAAICAVLWAKLKGGANSVEIPPVTAP